MIETLFRDIVKLVCPICKSQYDKHKKRPVFMCSDLHLCCSECMNTKVRTRILTQCTYYSCRKKPTTNFQTLRYPFFNEFLQFKNLMVQMGIIGEKQSLKKIKDINSQEQYLAQRFHMAQQLFIKGNAEQCSKICKQLILLKPLGQKDFKCLGCPGQLWLCNNLAFSQYYQRQILNRNQRSVYDLFNLCIYLNDNFDQDELFLLSELNKKQAPFQVCMGLGILYYNNKNKQMAKHFFRLVCKLNPNSSDRYYKQQFFMNQIKNFLSSDEIYQRRNVQLKLQEKPAYIQFIQVSCDYQSQQYHLSIEKNYISWYDKLKRLIEKYPTYYPAYYSLAQVQIFSNQFKEAIINLQVYLKYVKSHTVNETKTKFYLALAYSQVNRSDKDKVELAIAYVNNYIDVVESQQSQVNIEAYWILAKSYKQTGCLDSAQQMLQVYQQACQMYFIIEKEKKIRENQREMERLLKYYPQSLLINNKQNLQKNIPVYKLPDKYWLLNAQIHSIKNNFDLAIPTYEKYLKIHPEDDKVKEQLLNVLLKCSELQDGQAIFPTQRINSSHIRMKLGKAFRLSYKYNQKPIKISYKNTVIIFSMKA